MCLRLFAWAEHDVPLLNKFKFIIRASFFLNNLNAIEQTVSIGIRNP